MALDQEQETARTVTGRSVIVSASAGAGKTSVLVQRLLKRCVDDKIELDRILAMTFTKAAAEEMKKRLAGGLNERYAAASDEEAKAYIAGQLVKLADASITTIDSYCLSIIQKYCSVIGLDPAACRNILDDGTARRLQHDAFREAMSAFIRQNREKALRLSAFFSARSEDYSGLEQTLFAINTHALSGYDPDAFYRKARQTYHIEHGLKDLPPEILDAFFESLQVRIENLLEMLGRMRTYALENEESKVDPATLDAKQAQLTNCLHSLQARSYSGYQAALETAVLTDPSPDGKDPRYKAQRTEFIDALRGLFAESYDESVLAEDIRQMEPLVMDLLDLAAEVQRCFRKRKTELACMDFTDMERYALDILNASDGAVADLIRSQLDEIMVDEFQDTSELQNAIIEKIARPDNVFRVGDVKQSIYRFRQARPSLMRGLLSDHSQCRITLRHNYRSRKSIVEFNNMLYGKLMNISGFADSYTDDDRVSIGRDAQDEPPVPVTFALVENDERHSHLSDKERKAYWIAEQMLAMHAQGREFRDFCVLVRSHQNKLVLRSAFEKYGIPYEIDTREGFFNSALCLEMQGMVRCLLNPADSISLAAVLTGAFCRLKDEDLARMKTGRASLYEGVREIYPEILQELEELRGIADIRGIPELLKEIAVRHSFYSHLTRHEQANFDFLLEKTSSSAVSDLYSLLQMMENGSDEKSSEASSRGQDDNTVGVTTIHQSKGLQYKVVFLWGDDENRFREKSDPVIIHDDLMLGIPFFDPETRLRRSTAVSAAVRHALDTEDQQEFIRLLYVATTRAEERMFIVDSMPDKPFASGLSRSVSAARKGMTGLLMAAADGNPLLRKETVVLQDLPPLERQQTAAQNGQPEVLPQTADLLPPLKTPSGTEFTTLPPLDGAGRTEGMHYGSIIHTCIENLPLREWTSDDFSGYGLKAQDTERLIAFSRSDVFQHCLTMEIRREEPFFVIDHKGGQSITGSFDMIAVGDSEVILIDFKTDHTDPASIRNRYENQIGTYRKALEILYPGRQIRPYAYSIFNSAFLSF